ncbi:MAG: hypothetical protein JST21_07655 [Bacteroidetes bacterium]|nr:hypothetical protein [Bacteroidota bacterium]
MKTQFSILLLSILLYSCSSDTTKKNINDSNIISNEKINTVRSTVNPDAIKTYEETVKSFETTDNFNVSVFETNQTFNYLIKISYKQLNVTDTLHVPDFSSMPSVDIIKGDSIRPSCVIGFYDNDKNFKVSKLIYFKDKNLKIKVLKYYAVYSK